MTARVAGAAHTHAGPYTRFLRAFGAIVAEASDVIITNPDPDRDFRRFARLAARRSSTTLRSLVPIVMLIGCTDGEPQLGQIRSAVTVAGAVSSGCSTAVVIGLSRQIADEVGCEHPGGLVPFAPSDGLVVTSNAVLPYLAEDAKVALEAVASGRTIEVNSAFRTIAQQYLLFQWYQDGDCGITAAATVGDSNHESGRAVDLENWDSVVSAMAAHGWDHDVPGDEVHFDHLASDDIRGQDVMAFQKLWNRNHPDDVIGEDGSYGPETEARLSSAPATGLPLGASCFTPSDRADVVAVNGPDRVAPSTRAHYTITLRNATGADWPETAELVITSASSPLHDAGWLSATEVAAFGTAIPAGAIGEIELDVTTPSATVETPVFEQLQINDGGTALGSINLALTVVPDLTTPASGDGDDRYDQVLTGGCAAGGGGRGSSGVLVGLWVVRRRRRR